MNRVVPLNDLVRQNRAIQDSLIAAAHRVIERGWYVLGSECADFEVAFAKYCGASHAIGVANGTDAIELALRAVGVDAGQTVATVANAGFYSSASIRAIGAKPVYIDVLAETQLMSVNALSKVLSQRPIQAVIVTHLYGRLADIEEIVALCEPLCIPVIEDCAQSHGARRGNGVAGSFGVAGCFSFYPTKNLGALGDGGAITTSDAALAKRVEELRQYGWSQKYNVNRAGGRNSRLDEMQAALLLVKLPYVGLWNEDRRKIARRYSAEIKNSRVVCPDGFEADNSAHLFVVRCENRDALRSHLQACGIASDVHYPTPDHLQPAYAEVADCELPETESLAGSILTIPCFNGMEETEVTRVIAAVNSW